MMHAYNEMYVYDAMKNLGEAVDYAVNACGYNIDDFFSMFMVSHYAEQFGQGVPWVVCGMSGTEMVFHIIKKVGLERDFPPAQIEYDCSPEYWCGWVLAYYQWKTRRTFQEILSYVPAESIRNMYWPCHEASEDWFVDRLNVLIGAKDINKASVSSVVSLAKALGCGIEDILDKNM